MNPLGLCCRGLHIFKTIMNFNGDPPREAVLPAGILFLSFSLPRSHTLSLFISLFLSFLILGKNQAELLIHDMKM